MALHCPLPQSTGGGVKQRARAGPAHGWMAHGWTEQASSGIRSQENTQDGHCIPSLGILLQEAVRLGSRPGASQWLSMAPLLAPPFPTWILLSPFSFGERLTTSHLLLSPPLTSPVSHQGFLGLLSPPSREMLLGRQPHRCAPGSGPSLLPGPELPVSSPSGPLWSGPLLIGPSLNE